MRLKSKLLSLNADKTTKVKVYSPRNCEELRIPFKADKTAKVVGKLASIPPPTSATNQSQLITGVLVQNDFKMSLMAPEDLREFAGLTTTTIMCKQRMTLSAAGIDLIKWALEGSFGSIDEMPESKSRLRTNGDIHMNGSGEEADEEFSNLATVYLVMGCVIVRHKDNGEVELEWEGNMLNDGIADAVMGVLLSVESSPAAVKRKSQTRHQDTLLTKITESSSKHSHSHDLPAKNPHTHLSGTERLERLFMFLEAQFGADNVSPIELPKLKSQPAVTSLKEEKVKEEASDSSVGEEDNQLQITQRKEIERLHKIGIPVPGVEIRSGNLVAKVWLEDLEIECPSQVFSNRVRAVVERAVEVSAPLWV